VTQFSQTEKGWIRFESDYKHGGCVTVHLSKNAEGVYCDDEFEKHQVTYNEETKIYRCSCGATRRKVVNLPKYPMHDSRD